MMLGYARARGLRRRLVPVPVLTPRAVVALGLLGHAAAAFDGRTPLIEGVRNEVVVRDDSARELFPDLVPIDYRPRSRARSRLSSAGAVETSWADALSARRATSRR